MPDSVTVEARELTTDEKIDAIYRIMRDLEANLKPAVEKLSSGGIMGLLGMGRK